MNSLYNTFVLLYGFAINLVSPFNAKAKLWIKGRKNWKNKFREEINFDENPIWMHCSSLGEFEQGRPVLEEIKSKFPNRKIVISFFSPSGYEVRKDYKGADFIFYLPLDTKENASFLLDILKPEMLILVKYEYWFNLLNELQKRNIPTFVISAIFRKNQIFFKPFGKWFRETLQRMTHIFVQDDASKKLLNQHEIEQVSVSGDTRFDRVKEIQKRNNHLDFIEKFKGNSKLIVVGSSWAEDEELFRIFIDKHLEEDWKIVIAPHDINLKKIENFQRKLSLPSTSLSKINTDSSWKENKILIIDFVGILTKIYSYADLAYVGGGMSKYGVHNVLEPAVFGIPVVYGKKHNRHLETIELIQNEGAKSFNSIKEGIKVLNNFMLNTAERERYGKNAFNFVQNKPSSAKIILDYLSDYIKTKHQ